MFTAEQRVSKAVVDIMASKRYTALAGVLMIGDRVVDDAIPTACTNGRDEWYGRGFVDALNDAELRFLILHEAYHKMYKHLTTWQHLAAVCPQTCNAACDYVINGKLVVDNRDGFAMMPRIGGLYDAKYDNMNAAQVFAAIYEKPDGGEEGEPGEPGEGSAPSNGKPHKGFDEHDWAGAKELTEAEVTELAKEIDSALRQGALMAGKTGSGGNRDITELLEPQVDWREVLRDFICTTCAGKDYSTWARPNRRFIGAGIYMPSGITEQIGELVVAIDTSGSIGAPQLAAFLSEVRSIATTVHPEKIRVMYWDTKVCREEVYLPADFDRITTSTKPAGGGGTNVECVPAYITEHTIRPQAVIVLTDGYLGGSWGAWNSPVLWCVLNNKRAQPDNGVVVHIQNIE